MLEWINRYALGIAVPVALILFGVYFGSYLGWFHLLHPVRTVRAAFSKNGRSAFSALCLALAGTLGVGNVVGVAAALTTGGSGAIFWMWVSAFFAMILKYAEIVLAMSHRRREGGGLCGSAMYYISDAFSMGRRRGLGNFLASAFALLLVVNSLTMGSAIQSGAVTDALFCVFSLPESITAITLVLLTLFSVRGGKRGVMRLTERLVPFMTVGYLIITAAALVLRSDRLPAAFIEIFSDAFNPNAAAGGILGFLTSRALRFGTMRGLISNEAGCGTSPMAHSSTEGRSPAAQGVWGIFEVFVDTMVLCTATALVIIVSGVPLEGGEFMMITVGAYSEILGVGASYFMAVAVLFFGFATIVCWWSYGMDGVRYLFGKRWAGYLFFAIYLGAVLLGGLTDQAGAWQLADLSIGAMTLINLSALYILRREIKKESGIFLSPH